MSDGKTGYGQKIVVKHEEFGMGGNILEIEVGKRTDMIFHIHTRKVVYVLMGKVNVIILTEGKMAKVEMASGASFAVKEGLIYQLEAIEKAVVVEFLSHYDEKNPDLRCVSKGSVLEAQMPVTPAANVVMTKEDNAVVAPVPPPNRLIKEGALPSKPKGKKKKK